MSRRHRTARLFVAVLFAVALVPVGTASGAGSPLAVRLEQVLSPTDGADLDWFGRSIAMAGDTAVVGASRDDDGGANSGSAYVFQHDGSSWAFQQKLTADDAEAADEFGWSVAVAGDTIVVGAKAAGIGSNRHGAVYIFERSGTVWSQTQKLRSLDNDHGDEFGASVVLVGTIAFVGAPGDDPLIAPGTAPSSAGAVYVFEHTGQAWTQVDKLLALDPTVNARLGHSLAADSTTAIAGAPGVVSGTWDGAAYVIENGPGGWQVTERLPQPTTADGDQLGTAVGVSGDIAIVGAPSRDIGGKLNSGAAFVYQRTGAGWGTAIELVATEPGAGDSFGAAVAVAGSVAAVGAPFADGAVSDAGATHVFERTGMVWSELPRLTAPVAATFDQFGAYTVLEDRTLLVADLNYTVGSAQPGAVLAYNFNHAPVAGNDGPYQIATGATLTVDAVAGVLANDVDADGDPLTVGATIATPSHGGLVLKPDGSFSYTHDGSATMSDTFTYVASDGADESAPATVSITITPPGQPPIVTLPPPPGGIEGSPVVVAASFTDPGAADTHTATITWGDGTTTPATVGPSTITATHTYTDDGTYTITVAVTDDDGSTGTATTAITVANVTPTVSAEPNLTGIEYSPVTVAASFTDPGAADTHTATITWGDGTTTPATVGPSTITATHTYTDDGTYTITVAVTDDDGSTGTATTAITIDPADPRAVDPPEEPPDAPVPRSVGLVDTSQGEWHLRTSSGEVMSFYFGNPDDYPIAGDWDCDGIDTPGLYRRSDGFVYLRNSNTTGIADIRFFFGNPGDLPLAGDFDGDGCDSVSIYRPDEARFYIINELGANDGGLGAADVDYLFGDPGDKPFVGDFDGDGIATVGLHRESTGLVYFRQMHTQGIADHAFIFGDPGDRLVSGDWGDVDRTDTPAVFRPSDVTFYFRHTNTQGNADHQLTWGAARWLPVAGFFGP